MAGLKKKKKEKSGSPNTVLVVFLVLFVLVCIGLGVWVYYAEAAKEDLRTARVKSDAAEKAGKITRDYYQFLWLAMREAAGDKLDGDELTILNASREEFGKAGYGTFKDQKNNDLAKKVFEDLHESMALPKEDKTFEKNMMTELKVAKRILEEKIGDLKKQTDKNIRVELEIGKQNTKQDAFHQTANAAIQKGNQAALNEAKLRSKEFDDLNNQVKARVADIVDLNAKILAMEEDKDLAVKKKDLKIRELVAELNDRKSGDVRDAQNPPRGDSAPLVLDISSRQAALGRRGRQNHPRRAGPAHRDDQPRLSPRGQARADFQHLLRQCVQPGHWEIEGDHRGHQGHRSEHVDCPHHVALRCVGRRDRL